MYIKHGTLLPCIQCYTQSHNCNYIIVSTSPSIHTHFSISQFQSFFIRHDKDGASKLLDRCDGNCVIDIHSRTACKKCRFLKCQQVGMARKGGSPWLGLLCVPLINSIIKCGMKFHEYPFPNFNGYIVEVWGWISNFVPYFTEHVITHPCWDLS